MFCAPQGTKLGVSVIKGLSVVRQVNARRGEEHLVFASDLLTGAGRDDVDCPRGVRVSTDTAVAGAHGRWEVLRRLLSDKRKRPAFVNSF